MLFFLNVVSPYISPSNSANLLANFYSSSETSVHSCEKHAMCNCKDSHIVTSWSKLMASFEIKN